MDSKRRDKSGFTLIELMVSMSIIGILVLGSALIYTQGIKSIEKARAKTTAATLASNQIELITWQIKSNQYKNEGRVTKTIKKRKYEIEWNVRQNKNEYEIRVVLTSKGLKFKGETDFEVIKKIKK